MTSADVVGQDRGKIVDPEDEFPGGFAGLWARAWLNLRTGNLGPAPIIVGLAVTVAIFGLTANNFFTSTNFVNLVTESAGTAMLAYGVVFVRSQTTQQQGVEAITAGMPTKVAGIPPTAVEE